MAKITADFGAEWRVEDYKALYELILSMSFDIEGIPLAASGRVEVIGGKAKEEYKQCLSFVAAMLDCINDVPAAKIRQANDYYHLNIKPYDE